MDASGEIFLAMQKNRFFGASPAWLHSRERSQFRAHWQCCTRSQKLSAVKLLVIISLYSQLLAASGLPNPASIHIKENRFDPLTSSGTAIYWGWRALSASQQGLPPSSQQYLPGSIKGSANLAGSTYRMNCVAPGFVRHVLKRCKMQSFEKCFPTYAIAVMTAS